MKKETVIEEILEGCRAVRRLRPLVHMIPNYVTAGICADAISAVGGRPLMASAPEEMEEITASADGLVINMGQPSEEKYRACRMAMVAASQADLPVLFDPVGAGASRYRQNMTGELTKVPWSGVIKGNSSEIRTVLTGTLSHQGVDSLSDFENVPDSSAFFEHTEEQGRSLVLASTGLLDHVFWRNGISRKIHEITLGHGEERQIVMVGTGCIAGALGGTFLAAARKQSKKMPDMEQAALLTAAAMAMTAFAGAGDDMRHTAGKKTDVECSTGCGNIGYGTYQMNLLNRLSILDEEAFARYLEMNLEVKEE